MSPEERPGAVQGELIIVAAQSGQMRPVDFSNVSEATSESWPTMPIVERNIHLQNAVTYLAAVSMRTGFIERDNADIAADRTHATPAMRQGVEARRAEFAKKARESFVRATGNEAMVAAGIKTEKELEPLNRQMFSDFIKRFYGTRHYKEAQAYRRRLISNNLALELVDQTKTNRTQNLRPHAPAKKIKGEAKLSVVETLDTPERLRVIVADPRAGFIPTTNREKNQVLTFLDYLDNPEFPFGVNNQFLEVFNHSQWVRRRNQDVDSSRGPVSIVYEFGDYLNNATTQIEALKQVEQALAELPNQKVTLGEEHEWMDLSLPGLAALVRYHDLAEFMQTGSLADIKDPLRTQEQRWTRTGSGQHKVVEDRYTARQRSEKFDDYVRDSITNMTVGAAQNLIMLAITDQLKRQAFMLQRLEEIAMPPASLKGKARKVLREASDAALQIVGELKAA